ncbi:MAG: response regulator [Calditrichaeota bacterium]|nr:MAG: response regulator [Calditrichota bacterium]
MKKKILIIEDYAHIVEVLRVRLENAGFEIITALDGQEGLQRAREDNPDLIILDVMLPKMNGYKLCRLLKFDKKYQKTPIFMLTSRRKNSDRELGKKTGADEYITKPYEPKELVGLINHYLKLSELPA